MTRIKIEIASPGFWSIPPNRIEIEERPEDSGPGSGYGRTYFLHRGEIVAVARQVGEQTA